ncbi:MAG: hypothetical protein DWI22_09340 [Planctomycetota bacterium]|nr:MAG: hypothetical protein DWI22_09340 [Planctomycetota bacterium]
MAGRKCSARPFGFSKERNERGDFGLEWKSWDHGDSFSGGGVSSFGMIRLRKFLAVIHSSDD